MTENRERKENEKENKEERSSKKYIFRANVLQLALECQFMAEHFISF